MPPKYYVSRNTINVLFTLIKYICIMTLQTYAYRCKKRYFVTSKSKQRGLINLS